MFYNNVTLFNLPKSVETEKAKLTKSTKSSVSLPQRVSSYMEPTVNLKVIQHCNQQFIIIIIHNVSDTLVYMSQ